MCLAIPGIVKKIRGREAMVEYNKEKKWVLLGENGVKQGDFVMVEMGVISKVLSEAEADQCSLLFS